MLLSLRITARCRRLSWASRIAILIAAGTAPAAPVAAQLPGLPTLQSAFTSPGRAVAANYGTGDLHSVIGLAGSWTPTSNRFQLSGGLGAVSTDGSDGRATGVGVRAAVPIRTRWTGSQSALGLALFAGAGGAWRSGAGELSVPVGASVAYRRRLGATRAISAYIAPYFLWSRRTGDGLGDTRRIDEGTVVTLRDDSNLLRAAAGVDVLLTTRLSLTVGYDFGAGAELGRPGPTGGIFGAGLGVRF